MAYVGIAGRTEPFRMKVYSTEPMQFIIQDEDGTAVTLTDMQVAIILGKAAGAERHRTDDESSQITIDVAADGKVTWTPAGDEWTSNDILVPFFFWIDDEAGDEQPRPAKGKLYIEVDHENVIAANP